MVPVSAKLDGQFVVSTDQRPCPEGWHVHRVGEAWLNISPVTPAIPVLDRDGNRVGLLLGTAIDLDRSCVLEDSYVADGRLTGIDDVDRFVDDHIYRLSGCFLFILSARGVNRIYLDADGSLSIVYDPEARAAGATAAALLDADEYRRRFRSKLYETLDVDNAGWFTAGLTAHEGINRLLCNHYLDLDDWTATRHWPLGPIAVSSDPKATYARICDRITRTIEILARGGDTGIALTAGSDSRLLLACSRRLVDDVSFVTVKARGGDVDVACAIRLAREFGLRHELLPFREATKAQAELWKLRAGHCVGGNNVLMHPSVEPMEGRYFVGGLGGEVGRGFLWLNADEDTPLDTSGLVARLKLPQNEEVLAAVEAWLKPLSGYDTLFKLDIAYLELRMSCWGFCDSYVKPRQKELHPMISRDNYVDMLSIPAELRRKNDICMNAIRTMWPEVLNSPINKYGNYKDYLRPLENAIKNPRKVSKKVAQLVRAWR